MGSSSKKHGKKTRPVGGFINKKIIDLRGKSYMSKEELQSELPSFKAKYGISMSEYISSTLRNEYLDDYWLKGVAMIIDIENEYGEKISKNMQIM